MIKDLLDIMQHNDIEKTLYENYVYRIGTYVYVNPYNGTYTYKIKDADSRLEKGTREEFLRDYLSRIISVNKSVDRKKQILSNSYLSFVIKGKNIKNLTEEIIENYYKIPDPKPGKIEQALQDMEESRCLPLDEKHSNICKNWIKENIEVFADEENYVCIYFLYDLSEYLNEELRYLIRNIFLSSAYCEIEQDKNVIGPSPFNFTLNQKKPYLLNDGRKSTVPVLYSLDEVVDIKRLFDILYHCASRKHNLIYIDIARKEFLALEMRNGHPDHPMYGYIMYVELGQKGDVIIKHFDTCQYNPILGK